MKSVNIHSKQEVCINKCFTKCKNYLIFHLLMQPLQENAINHTAYIKHCIIILNCCCTKIAKFTVT